MVPRLRLIPHDDPYYPGQCFFREFLGVMQTRYDARARIRSIGQEVILDRGATSNDTPFDESQFSSSHTKKRHDFNQHLDQSESEPNDAAFRLWQSSILISTAVP